MTSGTRNPTEQRLQRHLHAFRTGDVEAILAGFAADAVLITPMGVMKGHAQIRPFFQQVFTAMFPPDSLSLEVSQQVVEGDIAYILWSASSALYRAPFSSDTFVMRDGKIVAQTFVGQLQAVTPS